MISTLGKILDPIADKLTQFVLTFCLSLEHPELRPVLVLFVVKELFQAVMGIIHLRRGRMLPGALMAGKVCTTVLFVSLIAMVLLPGLDARRVWECLSGHYAGARLVTVAPFGGDEAVIYADTLAGKDTLRLQVSGCESRAMVTALFDNLGKGASGAAIQNMNLLLGLDETTGLSL